MNKKILRSRFKTSKEELAKLGSEFYSEALPLMDKLLETTFYILLDKKPSKKIILQTYYETIEYCDVTKAHSDWFSWIHRIWMREINDFYSSRENDIKTIFDFIDYTKTDLQKVKDFFERHTSDLKINERELANQLRKLPALLRIPLIMKEVHSLNYEKIAEFIDVPTGVIATRIFRARKLLYLFLNENFDYEQKKKIGLPENFEPIIFEYRKCALTVDNELSQEQIDELREKIKSDKNLESELLIQKEIKKLFSILNIDLKVFRRTKKKIEKMAKKRFPKTE
jgi:DNA-directed RNA polymerase specialized sigma24 family protein